jgi:Holliday junction resolvase RusA-like endonuclease
MSSMTVEIDGLPNSNLSPNARIFYKKKSGVFRREKKRMEDLIIMSGFRREKLLERATLELRFYPSDKRKRDIDNLISASKPWIDAMQGLIIVNDDFLHIPRIAAEYMNGKWKKARTEIIITELP